MIDEELVKLSGHDREWWVAKIQGEIATHSRKTDDPNHDHTDVDGWLIALATKVRDIVDGPLHKDVPVDENVLAARIMALVLATWAARVHRAKCYDPRRPVEKRRESMKRLLAFQMALTETLMDESLDHVHFPGQSWDPPFSPEAKDGTFV